MALRRPRKRNPRTKSHGESTLCSRLKLCPVDRQRDLATGSRGNVESRQLPSLNPHAIDLDFERPREPAQILKIKSALDPNLPFAKVTRSDAHRLTKLLDLPHRGMRSAIGPHHAVDAEVRVVGCVCEIATICPVVSTAIVLALQPLVHPVPDKPTLKAMMRFNCSPVVRKASAAVPHRVGVLAHNEWTMILVRPCPGH